MGRKMHKPERIVAKLRQVDVLTSKGQTMADAIRSIGVTVGEAAQPIEIADFVLPQLAKLSLAQPGRLPLCVARI